MLQQPWAVGLGFRAVAPPSMVFGNGLVGARPTSSEDADRLVADVHLGREYLVVLLPSYE